MIQGAVLYVPDYPRVVLQAPFINFPEAGWTWKASARLPEASACRCSAVPTGSGMDNDFHICIDTPFRCIISSEARNIRKIVKSALPLNEGQARLHPASKPTGELHR